MDINYNSSDIHSTNLQRGLHMENRVSFNAYEDLISCIIFRKAALFGVKLVGSSTLLLIPSRCKRC